MNHKSGNPGRILVVGGGGFLGGALINRLVTQGCNIISLDRHRPAGISGNVEWITGSASDGSLMAMVARECSCVVFLAANSLPISSNQDLSAEVESHVRVAVKAAEICCAQGVKCFIFASSGGTVYDPSDTIPYRENSRIRPISAYGVSKAAVENYLEVLTRLREMRTISLRIANAYGPGQRSNRGQGFIGAALMAQVNRTVLPCWGDGSAVRDFVYVDDIAEAVWLCCMSQDLTGPVNIGSGTGTSLMEVIRLVERIGGRSLEVEHSASRLIDIPVNVLDVSLADRLLGWSPQTSLEDGVRKTWDLLQSAKTA